jgi:hypothetical protein
MSTKGTTGMTAFSANPFAYIFPLILLIGVGGYYLYGAIDRVGLATQSADAVVTGKQVSAGGTTYNTNIVAGRAWTQAYQQADFYAVTLNLGTEPAVALVTKEAFDSYNAGDSVKVKWHRTRLSGRLEVIDVSH